MIDEMLKEARKNYDAANGSNPHPVCYGAAFRDTAAGTVRVVVSPKWVRGLGAHAEFTTQQRWYLSGRKIAKADLARELSKAGCL